MLFISHTLHGTAIYAAPLTHPWPDRQSVLAVPCWSAWSCYTVNRKELHVVSGVSENSVKFSSPSSGVNEWLDGTPFT